MPVDVKLPLTVGEIARRSGVTVATVHFYEARGLIEGWRSEGNQRRFSRDVLRRVAFIRVAQRAGLALSTIKAGLDELPPGRAPTAKDWNRLSTRWRDMLTERIGRLVQLRDQLDSCIGCGCLSMDDCPLRNPEDRLREFGEGAVLLESPGAVTSS